MSQATPTRVKYYRSARTVTGWTILLLVLLRVAVGWHFFYEGIFKLTSGGSFSSTPYLMAATGPLDHVFHWMVDDMDGTKKRMTQNYLYEALDKKCETILRHYGATEPQGYQNKEFVEKLQKKANGGLTDLQLNALMKDIESQRQTQNTLKARQEQLAKENKALSPAETEELAKATARLDRHVKELENAQRIVNGGLTEAEYQALVTKQIAGKLTSQDKIILEKANTARQASQPTPAEHEDLIRESKKLTREQVDSLKAFVERKKHGPYGASGQNGGSVTKAESPAAAPSDRKNWVPDPRTVAAMFDNDQLFVKQVSYAGEYADPKATDKTDQLTVVTYSAIPEKQTEIVGTIQAILDDLDAAVKKGVTDQVLAEDQTAADRLAQLEKLGTPLEPVKIVPDGAADSSWITPGYVESLVTKRYDLLRKAYELTDRQDKSRYGSRYRDQKLRGDYDRNNVDFVLADPDFKNDLDNYKQLLDQITGQEKWIDTQYDDQRLVYDNGKKRDGLRNKLLARVEAPAGDIDLQKIQAMGEYIGPIKELTQAQFAVGPVPVNPRELEFPGKLLKQAGFDVPKKTLTYWQDLGMMLGLTIIGACLILGLFTRLAALGGAVMLAMFYLAMPPFPGAHVPENAAEGHYLIVNKNLIEMLVMLAFATSGIGRWYGLDAFLHAIFGRRQTETADLPPVIVTQPGSGSTFSATARAFPPERTGARP
jgi:uncharacterized membrane protein YphA (DoxX/SURF4 family)